LLPGRPIYDVTIFGLSGTSFFIVRDPGGMRDSLCGRRVNVTATKYLSVQIHTPSLMMVKANRRAGVVDNQIKPSAVGMAAGLSPSQPLAR
jgi:hypothetical protein